jgi:hypothetical protein
VVAVGDEVDVGVAVGTEIEVGVTGTFVGVGVTGVDVGVGIVCAVFTVTCTVTVTAAPVAGVNCTWASYGVERPASAEASTENVTLVELPDLPLP